MFKLRNLVKCGFVSQSTIPNIGLLIGHLRAMIGPAQQTGTGRHERELHIEHLIALPVCGTIEKWQVEEGTLGISVTDR